MPPRPETSVLTGPGQPDTSLLPSCPPPISLSTEEVIFYIVLIWLSSTYHINYISMTSHLLAYILCIEFRGSPNGKLKEVMCWSTHVDYRTKPVSGWTFIYQWKWKLFDGHMIINMKAFHGIRMDLCNASETKGAYRFSTSNLGKNIRCWRFLLKTLAGCT